MANAGLVLPMTLAGRLGLKELVDADVHLGDAPGRANVGQKAVALVASALVGGNSIHAADVLQCLSPSREEIVRSRFSQQQGLWVVSQDTRPIGLGSRRLVVWPVGGREKGAMRATE